jgi:cell division protein FtsQ
VSERSQGVQRVLHTLWQRVRTANYRAVLHAVVRVTRRIAARPLLAASLVAVVLVSTGAIVVASGALDVRHVNVVGASRATTARINAMAKSVVGDPMMTVKTSSLRSRVAALPQVADVHVGRVWPNTLRVQIVERRPTFGVEQPSGWLLIDQSGASYMTVAHLPAHVLPLSIANVTTDASLVHAAVAVVTALPAEVRKNVTAVEAPSEAGIRLRLHGGSFVVWGAPEDSTRKARALAVLLKRHAHVYDVSTPGFITTS